MTIAEIADLARSSDSSILNETWKGLQAAIEELDLYRLFELDEALGEFTQDDIEQYDRAPRLAPDGRLAAIMVIYECKVKLFAELVNNPEADCFELEDIMIANFPRTWLLNYLAHELGKLAKKATSESNPAAVNFCGMAGHAYMAAGFRMWHTEEVKEAVEKT